MSVRSPVPSGQAPQPERSGQRLMAVLAGFAGAAQAFVLFATFLMGLGWGGPTYVAALVQAGAAFVPLSWLATRRRAEVLLVPLVSAALTAGLAFAGQAHGRATACSDLERAAAQELAPPPGTTVEVEGEYTEGCVARTGMALSNRAILEHYQAEFARLGWQETPDGPQTRLGTAAVKDGVHVVVDVEDATGSQTLEVVVGDPTTAAPCQIGTVGGYPTLQREPTRAVEPGHWMVLVSADDLPASVVLRDGSGAVVLDQAAQPQPDSADDLLQRETPTFSLDEGTYEVECRTGGGVVGAVPLDVAWAAPAPVEQEKSVVLRVFETPDGW